jgi:hypothetical protein
MYDKIIEPCKTNAQLDPDEFDYTIEYCKETKDNKATKHFVCPCGNDKWIVFRLDWTTWIECPQCGAVDVVHDG